MATYYIYETSKCTHIFEFDAPEGLSDKQVYERWDKFCDEHDKWDCYMNEEWDGVEEVEMERD